VFHNIFIIITNLSIFVMGVLAMALVLVIVVVVVLMVWRWYRPKVQSFSAKFKGVASGVLCCFVLPPQNSR
jgi:hypothetical protein